MGWSLLGFTAKHTRGISEYFIYKPDTLSSLSYKSSVLQYLYFRYIVEIKLCDRDNVLNTAHDMW